MPRLLQGSHERGFRLLLVLAVAVPFMVLAGAAWYDHDQVRQSERQRVASIADAVAGQAQAVMETSLLALDLVADRVLPLSMAEIGQSAAVHSFLLSLTAKLPQLESAFVVRPDGHIAASSRLFPMPAFDVSQRDYYRLGRKPAGTVFVSAPFHGMTNGSLAFVVTRARADGGLVGVTLSTAYFQRFYAGVTDPAGAPVVALLRSDGVFLLRFPAAQSGSVTRVTNRAVIAALAGDAPPVFRARSPQDGRQRLVALRPLRGVPMAVVYACSDAGYLTIWHRHLADLTVLAVLVSGILGLATRLAMLRARSERASLQRLLAETERREQAEAALRQSQKMEALGRLTGGVAHDFNNLLTAVMGSLEIAIRRSGDPGVLRLLEGAMDAARRGARLTRQMLAFSRQQQPVMQAVPVRSLIESAQDLLRRTLGPDIAINRELPDDLWWAHAEPTQLEVGLLNLAINARDAMPGGGALRFAAANLPATAPRPAAVPAGEFVVVRVADTGAGMPEAVRLRAAEPFFTTKDVGRGTGLGLSMVDGLARQSGGAMTIDSASGRGTTISLFLPRAVPPVEGVASEPDARAPRGRRLTVLVVDDDAAVRHTTTAMLQELGHAVVEAADGPEALAVAEVTALDLAVVDFAMPIMDGGALAAALVELRPGLPVLLLTGYADRAHADAVSGSFAGLLAKPCSLDEIDRAVQSATRTTAPSVPQAV